MNDATKQALNDFVQRIISAANSAADFTSAQVPLLVQEWLQWQLAEALFYVALSWIILGALWLVRKQVIKFVATNNPREEGFIRVISAVMLAVTAAAYTLPITITYGLLATKVWVAPRVVILEKFADLVK